MNLRNVKKWMYALNYSDFLFTVIFCPRVRVWAVASKKVQKLTEKVGAKAMGRYIEDIGAKEKQRPKVTLAYHPNIFDPTAPRRLGPG